MFQQYEDEKDPELFLFIAEQKKKSFTKEKTVNTLYHNRTSNYFIFTVICRLSLLQLPAECDSLLKTKTEVREPQTASISYR